MVTLLQDPFTAEAADLVRSLRRDYIGDRLQGRRRRGPRGGPAAMTVDFLKINEDYMDPILTFVLVLRLVLLMVAFRSILMSVFLTVLSVLSLYAGYGLVVYRVPGRPFVRILPADKRHRPLRALHPDVRTARHIHGLPGLHGIPGPRALRPEQGNPPEAIMHAFRRTGFVVMGAAAVMVVIFFAFSISKILTVAELGFGMAVAMLVDATLVNFLMSPAVMKILGKWIWWWPSWLNWVPDWRAHPGNDEVEPEENVFIQAGRSARICCRRFGVPATALALLIQLRPETSRLRARGSSPGPFHICRPPHHPPSERRPHLTVRADRCYDRIGHAAQHFVYDVCVHGQGETTRQG